MLPSIHRGRPLEKPRTPIAHNQARAAGEDYLDRISCLERDNERLRADLKTLAQHLTDEDNKLQSIAQECHQLQMTFTTKVQTDTFHMEKEKQKAAIVFGEMVRLAKVVEDLQSESKHHYSTLEQRFHSVEKRFVDFNQPTTSIATESKLKEHDHAIEEVNSLSECTNKSSNTRVDVSSLSELEARLSGQLDRLSTRVSMDKNDVLRLMEEQRDLQSLSESKRTNQMIQDTKRLSEHIAALEQLLLQETKSMTQHVQTIVNESDGKFRAVIDELGHEVRQRNAAYVQLDDELRLQITDLREATKEVTTAIQTQLKDLEEVVPLEIKARQKGDEKLRKRLDMLAKSTTHSIDTIKKDVDEAVGQAILRANSCVARQLELQSIVAKQTEEHKAVAQMMSQDLHGAIANAMQATAKEHAQRLVACLEVVDTVKQLRISTDERFDLLNQTWTTLDSKTTALLDEHHAAQSKAIEELHTRYLILQSNLNNHTSIAVSQLSENELKLKEIERSMSSQVAQLHNVTIDASVHDCLDRIVNEVVATAQNTIMDNQLAVLVSDQTKEMDQIQRNLKTSWTQAMQEQCGMDQRWYQSIERLKNTQTTLQNTLVTMAWNIENRAIDDTVATVLYECVHHVEESNVHRTFEESHRQFQLQLQVGRNKLEEVRHRLQDEALSRKSLEENNTSRQNGFLI
ncbi:hypothetical protein THRCLA_00009 [Thraustotheca clavata]|uniref:Uncharacterized protein n=1 Tax=Thraustotheca clavata TaxID=74557 RepID=A0A1W0ACR9_9STRA|nr:hypothetical protein THRCLA_00009 [Thraustotheca clavata]